MICAEGRHLVCMRNPLEAEIVADIFSLSNEDLPNAMLGAEGRPSLYAKPIPVRKPISRKTGETPGKSALLIALIVAFAALSGSVSAATPRINPLTIGEYMSTVHAEARVNIPTASPPAPPPISTTTPSFTLLASMAVSVGAFFHDIFASTAHFFEAARG